MKRSHPNLNNLLVCISMMFGSCSNSASLLNLIAFQLSKEKQDKSRVYIRPGCGGGGLSSQNCTLSHITSDNVLMLETWGV